MRKDEKGYKENEREMKIRSGSHGTSLSLSLVWKWPVYVSDHTKMDADILEGKCYLYAAFQGRKFVHFIGMIKKYSTLVTSSGPTNSASYKNSSYGHNSME